MSNLIKTADKLRIVDGPFVDVDEAADPEHPDRIYWLVSEEVFDWEEFNAMWASKRLTTAPRTFWETFTTWWHRK